MRTFEPFNKMGNTHKRNCMAVSYNGLWKLLIDKSMKKMDLVENENIGISSSTLAKMSRGETVSMSVLEKICMELDCDFGDLIHFEKDES